MTPQALAQLHLRSFQTPRPWSETEIAQILADPKAFLLCESGGFLIGRVVADEAEILTLAVDPDLRRQGIGARLVSAFLTTSVDRGAVTAFLEVSAENDAALALYAAVGFTATGRRRGYFRTPEGTPVDALVLSHNLRATTSMPPAPDF